MVFMIIISLSACNIDPEPTPIKRGLSQELVALLKDQYHVIIPKSAVFINGYYDNEYQDSAVHITFKVPSDLCNSLYDDDWSESGLKGSGPEEAERTMKFRGEPYTYLCYYPADEDGNVTVYFLGRYPQKTIT